jgi:hypothetical protein
MPINLEDIPVGLLEHPPTSVFKPLDSRFRGNLGYSSLWVGMDLRDPVYFKHFDRIRLY